MANILYIAQCFSAQSEPGGQGHRHYQHAMALAQDGHIVTVITAHSPQNATVQTELLNPNLKIIRLNAAKGSLGFGVSALWSGLQLRLRNQQTFNFVLGSSPPIGLAAAACLLAMLNRAAFYMEVRDLWTQTLQAQDQAKSALQNPVLLGLSRAVENYLYRSSRKILIASPAFCESIERQMPGSTYKTEYIPNGADLECYQSPHVWDGSYLRDTPENQVKFHVNYAGALNPENNLQTLLEAAMQLQAELPDVHFNLAGNGVQAKNLQTLAENLNLKNVQFWGMLPKNRISKFLMEGNLSIINYLEHPVYGQVMPHQLIDSMAAGRPIVAAVPPGQISRILHDSKAGLTVQPENVTALVEAIRWFYHNREQGMQMGRHGYQYVYRHFNRKNILEKFLKFFPRVIPLRSFPGVEARLPASSPPLTSMKNP